MRFVLGNSFFNWSAHYVPKEYNNEEKTLELKHKSHFKPGTHFFNTIQSLRFGSPKVGPLRFFLDLGFQWNTNGDNKLKNALNIDTGKNFHIGYKLTHDLTKVEKCTGLLMFKCPDYGNFYLKSECIKKHIIIGR